MLSQPHASLLSFEEIKKFESQERITSDSKTHYTNISSRGGKGEQWLGRGALQYTLAL